MDLSELSVHDAGGAELKHERLRSFLLNELKSGRLQPGEALPTELDLSRRLRISRNTVRQALGELERNGLIHRVRGKGTFVRKGPMLAEAVGMRVFALVLPELRSGYYPSMIRNFEGSAADLSYQVMTCNSNNDIGKQADIVLQLIDKQVAGVALVPTTTPVTPSHQVIQLQKNGIPVVCCHRRPPGVAAPLLALPFHEQGRRAGLALIERGHRHVAYIDTYFDESARTTLAGLRSVYEGMGLAIPDEYTLFGSTPDPDPESHEQEVLGQLKTLLSLPTPPTAIFTGFVTFGELVFLLFKELGVRVPQDISVLSFGGTWREGALSRRLASVVVDEAETARRAVQLLDEMCSDKRAIEDDETFSLPLSLYEGQTLIDISDSPRHRK